MGWCRQSVPWYYLCQYQLKCRSTRYYQCCPCIFLQIDARRGPDNSPPALAAPLCTYLPFATETAVHNCGRTVWIDTSIAGFFQSSRTNRSTSSASFVTLPLSQFIEGTLVCPRRTASELCTHKAQDGTNKLHDTLSEIGLFERLETVHQYSCDYLVVLLVPRERLSCGAFPGQFASLWV